MDFDSPGRYQFELSDPVFSHQAQQIASALARYDEAAMAKLMNLSQKLSSHVVGLYSHPSGASKPAIYAYRGDVYRGLKADSLSRDDIEWANLHLLIPSGLYGLVRPLDTIEEYRLEMKTKLAVDTSKTLYGFWGSQLAEYVESRDDIVLVLASDEYARAITTKLTSKTRVVEVIFQDKKASGFKTVPIYSKVMRGVMARYIITHRIDQPEDLVAFCEHGYAFDSDVSSEHTLVFRRSKPSPIDA